MSGGDTMLFPLTALFAIRLPVIERTEILLLALIVLSPEMVLPAIAFKPILSPVTAPAAIFSLVTAPVANDVEVTAPEDLRKKIQATLIKTLEKYENR